MYQGDWKEDADSYDGVEGNHGGNTGLKDMAIAVGLKDDAEIEVTTKKKTIKVYVSDIPLDEHPVKPAVVLDPFSGSGTSGVVALEHGRSYIGIELNPEYAELSERRLKQERTGLTTKKYREQAVELKEYW